MAFPGSVATVIARPLEHKGGFGSLTLTGATSLSRLDGQTLRIDPGGGTRVVTLAADMEVDGYWLEITNTADAAEDLTINDPAASTIVTISQNEKALVAYDGNSWNHYGITTIALT